MVYILNVETGGAEERAGWNGEHILMIFLMLDCPCILDKLIKARPTRCNKWWSSGNRLFLNMFRASLRPSSGEQSACHCLWFPVLAMVVVVPEQNSGFFWVPLRIIDDARSKPHQIFQIYSNRSNWRLRKSSSCLAGEDSEYLLTSRSYFCQDCTFRIVGGSSLSSIPCTKFSVGNRMESSNIGFLLLYRAFW